MRPLRPEPTVGLSDFAVNFPTLDELDDRISSAIGAHAIAIPSVRVALSWALSFLGFRRHADHVLFPRFVGRCILNSINRAAMPVEELTDKTRAVVEVRQFGFQQNVAAAQDVCRQRGIPYLQDDPFGPDRAERLEPGTVARFVAFSKVLPMLKGGFVLSEDSALLDAIRARRSETSAWSWAVLFSLGLTRLTRDVGNTALTEVAYELYHASAGDNAIFRANMASALDQLPAFEQAVTARVQEVDRKLKDSVLIPREKRLPPFALVLVGDRGDGVSSALRGCNFDGTLYHFDVNRNLLEPQYALVALLPLSPRIPQTSFDSALADIRAAVS